MLSPVVASSWSTQVLVAAWVRPGEERALEIKVTGRHVDVNEEAKRHLTDRIDRLTKHFNGVHKVDVTVSVEGTDTKVEMVVHAVRGVTLAAAGVGPNVSSAVDEVMDRMDRQVKKLKERLKDRRL
jgi:putative sigma-54 modulation protein